MKRELKRNEKMEALFNDQHGAKVRSFEEGEKVLVWNTRATDSRDKWLKGEVLKKLGNGRYRVIVNGRTRHVHANHLRKDETTPRLILVPAEQATLVRDTDPVRSPPKGILTKAPL